MKRTDKIRDLLDRMSDVIECQENKHRQSKWGKKFVNGTRRLVVAPSPGRVPYTLFLGPTYWNRRIGLDIRRYYTDPWYFLEFYLKTALEHYWNFEDDTFYTNVIPIHLGVTLEAGLFGTDIKYVSDKDPWVGQGSSVRVKTLEDIKLLPICDFFKNSHMQFVHHFYEVIRQILDQYDAFEVRFPDWFRSSFPLALELRGFESLLVETSDNKELVHALMQYITDYRIRWSKERRKYTGEEVDIRLGSDEITHPTVSPLMYEELILPYVLQLYKLTNRISYFHSCGNLTFLTEVIAKIPRIDVFHVSPVTDLGRVLQVFHGRPTTFQIWLHPVSDILFATRKRMKRVLKEISSTCRELGPVDYSIVSGHIQPMMELDKEDKQIRTWLDVCKEMFD